MWTWLYFKDHLHQSYLFIHAVNPVHAITYIKQSVVIKVHIFFYSHRKISYELNLFWEVTCHIKQHYLCPKDDLLIRYGCIYKNLNIKYSVGNVPAITFNYTQSSLLIYLHLYQECHYDIKRKRSYLNERAESTISSIALKPCNLCRCWCHIIEYNHSSTC